MISNTQHSIMGLESGCYSCRITLLILHAQMRYAYNQMKSRIWTAAQVVLSTEQLSCSMQVQASPATFWSEKAGNLTLAAASSPT